MSRLGAECRSACPCVMTGKFRTVCPPYPASQVCPPYRALQVCPPYPALQVCPPYPASQVCPNVLGSQVCPPYPASLVCPLCPGFQGFSAGYRVPRCVRHTLCLSVQGVSAVPGPPGMSVKPRVPRVCPPYHVSQVCSHTWAPSCVCRTRASRRALRTHRLPGVSAVPGLTGVSARPRVPRCVHHSILFMQTQLINELLLKSGDQRSCSQLNTVQDPWFL